MSRICLISESWKAGTARALHRTKQRWERIARSALSGVRWSTEIVEKSISGLNGLMGEEKWGRNPHASAILRLAAVEAGVAQNRDHGREQGAFASVSRLLPCGACRIACATHARTRLSPGADSPPCQLDALPLFKRIDAYKLQAPNVRGTRARFFAKAA